jgi:hypothetical protein
MPDQTQGFTPRAANQNQKLGKQEGQFMKSKLRPQITYSNVIATLALFLALGGAAVAASLPKNSVGTQQLKRGAVTAADLRKGAVRAGKLARKSVVAGKLGSNAVLPGNILNGAVTSAKIGNGAVIARSIKNGVVTTNKLANEAVTTAKLGKGSVTPAKLSDDFGPLVGTLKSGQTLRGIFALGGTGKELAVTIDGQSFQFPLANAPAATVINPPADALPPSSSFAFPPACPGLGSGQTPAAVAGNLCVYVTSATNLKSLSVPAPSVNRLGFGLEATAEDKEKAFSVYGQWAVTAP